MPHTTAATLKDSLAARRAPTGPGGFPTYTYPSVGAIGDVMPTLTGELNQILAEGGQSCALYEDAPLSYEEAIAAAKMGGRSFKSKADASKLTAAVAHLKGELRLDGERRRLQANVIGHTPAVARALSGSPRMMYRNQKRKAPAPVVKMGFHVGRPASMREEVIFARAAAILTLVEEVERSGARVELWAVWRNATSSMSDDPREGLNVDVRVKAPHDLYNPEALAFALDPSMQRRLAWPHIAFEHAKFDSRGESFQMSAGSASPAQAEGFEYFAPRPDSNSTSALWWYNHLRQSWGLSKAAA